MSQGYTSYAINGVPCTEAEYEAKFGPLNELAKREPALHFERHREYIPRPEDAFYDSDEVYGWNLRSPLMPADYDAIRDILRNVGDSPNALIDALSEAGFTVVK